MRLDKYLQVTGLIKRRTVAKNACNMGLVRINEQVAKPTAAVQIGDVIEISLASRFTKIKVLKEVTGNSIKKTDCPEYFEVISCINTNSRLKYNMP